MTRFSMLDAAAIRPAVENATAGHVFKALVLVLVLVGVFLRSGGGLASSCPRSSIFPDQGEI